MFYGQFGEDKYLSQFFDNHYKGTCVDVGAYDGVSGSNTYFFEKNGWNCLCVEPIPESFNKCNLCRKYTINCCVSNFDKDDVNFTVVDVGNNNLSAISSLEIDQRLIETHKHLLQSMKTISVKVKTLDTIFKETNFKKNIDFISIDTENTEINVLKGIDFNAYNIKFFIIENNFNETIIEDYLTTKNFTKFQRLGVNDFYVHNYYLNNKIYNTFDILQANYYDKEDNILGNVTNVVKLLVQRYCTSINNNVIVSNDIFTDTYLGIFKKLFITIKDTNNNKLFKFIFNENSILDFEFIFNELKKGLPSTSNKNFIEVSIGEIIDKYSILELKKKYISDQNKINEIQKEIDVLNDKVPKDSHFYKQLLYINELIWLDTDKIKTIKYDNTNEKMFAIISNEIFENNQKRFRLKNYFNIFQNSNIKEHKSYNDDICYVEINDEEEIYQKIPEINYLCISYDIIYISYNFKDIFNKLFKNPNIFFKDDLLDITNYHKKILNTFSLEINNRHHFDFKPIIYLSGGKLGDFINQLSVICEKYYETGRKGILYIYDIPGENFFFTLEKTYKDTYTIIKNLRFIKDYEIYNNEYYDIQLSQWRYNLVWDNWFNIFNKYYNVTWGKHKWLMGNYDDKWSKTIIFNITPYRFISLNVINMLKSIIKQNVDKCIFVSNEHEHYEYFSKELEINILYYKPSDFEEMLTIVNSCEMAYLGFSSMGTIANGLHKNHVLIGKDGIPFILNNLKGIMPHVNDILI